MKAVHGIVVQAVAGGVALIDIVLLGTQTEVGDLLQLFRHEQAQTESGQLRELHVALGQDVCTDAACDSHGPVDLHGHEPLYGDGADGQVTVDAHLAVHGHEVSVVGTGDGLVIVGGEPVGLELAVVVGGCAPHVQIHGAIQNFHALIGHPGEHTGELVIAVSEVGGGKGQIAAVLGDGDAVFQHRLSLPVGQGSLVAVVLILQSDLVKAQLKALGDQLRGVLGVISDLQEAASLGRDLDIQGYGAGHMGCDGRDLVQLPLLHQSAVTSDLIGCGDVVLQGNKIHIVVQGHLARLLVIIHHTHRAMYVLVLQKAGVGAAVGVNQAVHAEVAVVGILTVVAAVPVHILTVGSLALIDGVIAPLPDETAGHAVVGLDELPVVLQIAGAVAHGVGVFAHQVGLVGLRIVHILLQGFQGRVHIAVEVDVGEIVLALAAAVLSALVVGQAGGVEVLGPGQGRLEAATVGALVAHGPADDAGSVLVPLDAALGAFHGGLQELGVVGKGLVPVLDVVLPHVVLTAVQLGGAVALVVGLVDDQEAVLVAQLIEHGSVGVVAGADSVEVVLLDHPQIPLHVLYADHGASDGIRVVAVYAPELDGGSVEIDLHTLHLDLPDAHPVRDDLILTFDEHGVEIGLLGIPQGGLGDGQDRLMGVVADVILGRDLSGVDQMIVRIQQFHNGGDALTGKSEANADGSLFLVLLGGDEVVADVVLRALE